MGQEISRKMTFTEKVYSTIVRKSLPLAGKEVIVALSGGADSVALLRVLLELNCHCTAAHYNFHLRGKESMRDERFVRELCRSLGVDVRVAEADTVSYAAEKRVSVEMAARDLRYDFFASLCEELRAPVAVAHHRDDNCETLLLNLIRGTGLRGLCGMAYESERVCSCGKNIRIVRPLLDVSREEILEYLKSKQQSFVTDSTNLVADVKRNKIRLEIIPQLREINPSVCDTLQKEIRKFSDAYNIYKDAVGKVLDEIEHNVYGDEILYAEKLNVCVSPEIVLFEWLSPKGFNEDQIENASRNEREEARLMESNDYILYFNKYRYVVVRKDSATKGNKFVLQPGCEVNTGFSVVRIADVDKFPPKKKLTETDLAYIDADKVSFPLVLRRIETGDRFVPFGMKGSKLVSDFLKDCKVPVEERLRQLVVCDKEKIIWIVGRRVDNRVRISQDTANIKCMSVNANDYQDTP